MKISQRVSELLSGHNLHTEIYKEACILENYRWSYFTFLCPSSGDALYLYKVGISQRVLDLLSRHILKFTKGHNYINKCRWRYVLV